MWVGPRLMTIPNGPKEENPLRSESKKKEKEYVCEVTKSYKIKDLKAVGRKYAATINDVLVTAISKAIKQEMLAIDPEDKTEYVGAAQAISLREKWGYKNKLAVNLMKVKLPSEISEPVLNNLLSIQREYNYYKDSLCKHTINWVNYLFSWAPPSFC